MRELHTLPKSPPSRARGAGAAGRRWWTAPRAVALLAMVTGVGVLAACSSSSTNPSISSSSGPAPETTLSTTPNPSSFSGEPPSALASTAESALASVSAAAASAAAAAASFEASVSAQGVQARERAAAALGVLENGGNALGDVTITGLSRANTGGLHAVVVTITNSGLDTASYAVQVDFTDTSGKSVDSAVVGVENLPAGETAAPVAFSRKPPDQKLLPVVVKALRY
ncbi:hypothetical protein ACIGZJ_15180 [Kitasatospora sp. NPDC052868]|uniref:hypothetical protein n=1 Tax=Kitasatospora sp. NPDC052868 TaxID=3364060 RepID=UPI0037C877C1